MEGKFELELSVLYRLIKLAFSIDSADYLKLIGAGNET
jgi:hypothetical protein